MATRPDLNMGSSLAPSQEQVQAWLEDTAEFVRDYLKSRIPRRLAGIVSVEDLVQEIWVKAWQGAPRFREHGSDSVRNWLHTIAKNVLLNTLESHNAVRHGGGVNHYSIDDRLRTSLANMMNDLASPSRTPSSSARACEDMDAIRIAVAGLDLEQQHAVMLRYVDQMPNSEVATRLNKSVSAIENLLFRARRTLRKRLLAANELDDADT